jgi:hypothetical protein
VSRRAVILIQREQVLRYCIGARRIPHEIERLEASRARARQQLTDIRESVSERRGRDLASIFDAQLAMLDDPMLVPRAAEIIRDQAVNAGWAIERVFEEFSALFDEIADSYLRERKGDLADVVGRLETNLRPGLRRRLLPRAGRSVSPHRGRATPSPGGSSMESRGFATDAGSHAYPRPFSRGLSTWRSSAARRQPHHPARSARGHRRRSGRGPSSLARMLARASRHSDDRAPVGGKRRQQTGPASTATAFGSARRGHRDFPTISPRRVTREPGIGCIDPSSS